MSISYTDPSSSTQIKLSNGMHLNIPSAQAVSYPRQSSALKIIAPVSSSYNFGGFVDFLIDASTIGFLQEAIVAINVSALTAGNSPSWTNDAVFWFSHVDYLAPDGSLLDTYYPDFLYQKSLLTLSDEVKLRVLSQRGNAPLATRQTAASSSQTVYVPLEGFWRHGRGFLNAALASGAQWRIRLYLNNIAAVAQDVSGTFLPSASINSMFLNIIGVDYTTNPQLLTQIVTNQRKKGVAHMPYVGPVQQVQAAIASGQTSYKVLLSSLIGNFALITFTVRLASDVQNTSGSVRYNNYQAVSSFAIQNNASAIILGGVTYPGNFTINTLLPRYFPGDTSDLETPPATMVTAVSGAKYIYAQVFAEDVMGAVMHGRQTGFFTFTGQESLQINFASSLSANCVVDVIGWQYKYLATGPDGSIKALGA